MGPLASRMQRTTRSTSNWPSASVFCRITVRTNCSSQSASSYSLLRIRCSLLVMTRMLASSLNMIQLLHLVAARTATVLKVDRCSFVLVHPEGETARVAAASEDASLHDIVVSLKDYPEIREVIRTKRPFVVDRVEEHPLLKEILPALSSKGVGSLALFPMIHEEIVDGVLFLRSERFTHVLGERDIFVASAVAG